MTRKAKAFWIGFFAPVIPGWGLVVATFVVEASSYSSSNTMAFMLTGLVAFWFGGGSILLGLLIGFGARSLTRNKLVPPKCGKCGYDLRGSSEVGCPECGWGREAEA